MHVVLEHDLRWLMRGHVKQRDLAEVDLAVA